MCDFNSCIGGAFHFANGINNQAQAVVIGLWWEGNQKWTSRNPVLMENMNGQAVTFISCNFSGPATGQSVITIHGKASVNLIGCVGYQYERWIHDDTGGTSVAFSPQINYLGSGVTIVNGLGVGDLSFTKGAPRGSPVGKVPIRDRSGKIIGYVPMYSGEGW